jgi:CheY-like chemotaxis protein
LRNWCVPPCRPDSLLQRVAFEPSAKSEPARPRRTKVPLSSRMLFPYSELVSRDLPLIAVVDDDEAIRKALSRLLRAYGFRVESFSSGQVFLSSVREGCPDCVVLDLHMPDMDGLGVLRELRAREIDLPVIIITAHDEPGVRADCLAVGASAYLPKPIEGSILQRAIAEAIG